jgi:hypothetical protein
MEIEERFWSKVDWDASNPERCWPWLGAKNPKGYGKFHLLGATVAVHRLVYEMEVGPLVEGLEIDHDCKNRACVNPEHLRQMTHRENVFRIDSIGSETHCSEGHPRNEANTYVKKSDNTRDCRPCKARRQREYKARKKE